MNTLYYGDNLQILRDYIKDESVDLIYLDPPFNSSASYNILFKTPNGQQSESQMTAFEDTWHWTEESERAYEEICKQADPDIVNMIVSFRKFIGQNDMMAYLTMMTIRLIELHRVLKPTGSIYLHCDPTASHYLKIVMDTIFGFRNFQNEVIWKRTSSHNRAKRWGPVHDVLLFYGKSDDFSWNRVLQNYDEGYVEKFYRYVDAEGRKYQIDNLTGPGVRTGDSGKPWRGIDPAKNNRHWEPPPDRSLPDWFIFPKDYEYKSVQDRLDILDKQGLIYWPRKKNGVPRFKRYLLEGSGTAIQDIILDIQPLSAQSAEKLGYPTQKPVALLERIIEASSNKGDIVLDPFCGCGTTISAAQKLDREWIGIDITHLAINLIKNRLKDTFNLEQDKDYQVIGEPNSLAGAHELAEYDKYQFQWWITSFIGARAYQGKKRGADSGIDAVDFFSYYNADNKLITESVVISVKGGAVNVSQIRDLKAVVEREKAALGFFITLYDPSRPMEEEAVKAGFYEYPPNGRKIRKIQILTVKEILEGKKFDIPGDRFKHTKKAEFGDGTQKGLFQEGTGGRNE